MPKPCSPEPTAWDRSARHDQRRLRPHTQAIMPLPGLPPQRPDELGDSSGDVPRTAEPDDTERAALDQGMDSTARSHPDAIPSKASLAMQRGGAGDRWLLCTVGQREETGATKGPQWLPVGARVVILTVAMLIIWGAYYATGQVVTHDRTSPAPPPRPSWAAPIWPVSPWPSASWSPSGATSLPPAPDTAPREAAPEAMRGGFGRRFDCTTSARTRRLAVGSNCLAESGDGQILLAQRGEIDVEFRVVRFGLDAEFVGAVLAEPVDGSHPRDGRAAGTRRWRVVARLRVAVLLT